MIAMRPRSLVAMISLIRFCIMMNTLNSQRLIGDYWTKTHTCPHPVHCNSLLCRSRSSKKGIKHAGWACTIEVNSCNDLNEVLYVLGISVIFRVFNHAYIHAEEIMDQIDPLALDYYQMWVVPLMGW
jgi:hypothetical protein